MLNQLLAWLKDKNDFEGNSDKKGKLGNFVLVKAKKRHITTKNTQSNKDWKDFERMVARLEKALAQQGAIVKWNDRIPDKTTGELRQVDVSIRYKLGLNAILLTIECRKRNKKADSTWFEQLDKKRSEIGADKTIVVTSKSLTEPAYKKAKQFNIDVRQVNQLTASSIFTMIKITHVQRYFSVYGANISVIADVSEVDDIEAYINSIKYDDNILYPFNNPTKPLSTISFIDYLLHKEETEKFINSLPLAELGESEKINLMYEIPSDTFYIETPKGQFTLGMIKIIFTRKVKKDEKEPSRMFSYHNEENKLAETIEFDIIDVDGNKNVFSIHHQFDTPKTVFQLHIESEL